MKKSNYNVFVFHEPDRVYLGYNCVSGGLYVFSQQQYQEIETILTSPDQAGDSIVKEKLIKGRFIIDDDLDELQLLAVRNNTSRFNPNGLGMVITPTLNCNFDCPYCYVDREKTNMSRETVESLKKFFEKKLKIIDESSTCWTGGEPLLAMDIVDELNNFFRLKSEEKNKKYSSSMITNGYLLDAPMLERVLKSGIGVLQVTIDGDEHYHDRLRKTKGGKGTFAGILENVIRASRENIKIILRTNIQRDNYESVFPLIDRLANSGLNKDNVLYAPCMVMDVATGKGHYCGNCFSGREFSDLEPKILEYAMKKGFKLSKQLLSTTSTYCGANTRSLFVIDARADVLKCWCNLGRAENNMVGYIDKEGEFRPTNLKNYIKWMAWDPIALNECKTCNVLPICMGGCMYYNVMHETDRIDIGCSHRKYNIEEMLKLYFKFCKESGHAKLQEAGLINIGKANPSTLAA